MNVHTITRITKIPSKCCLWLPAIILSYSISKTSGKARVRSREKEKERASEREKRVIVSM